MKFFGLILLLLLSSFEVGFPFPHTKFRSQLDSCPESIARISRTKNQILASIQPPTPLQYALERTFGEPQLLVDAWDRITGIAGRCTQISAGLAVMFGTWLGVGQSPRSSSQHIGWLKARRVTDVTDDFTV